MVAHTFAVNDVTKQNQTITFGPLSDKGVGDAPFTLTASASSGLPVSFSTLTPTVCTVDNSQVTLAAVGLCTLRADQPGDATFNPAASVAQNFFVSDPTKQQQTVTFADISVKTLGDGPVALVATASSGLPVTISSQTPAVCTVAGAQATLLAGGVCTLVASQAGDGNFNPALPVVRTFLVRSGPNALYLPLIAR